LLSPNLKAIEIVVHPCAKLHVIGPVALNVNDAILLSGDLQAELKLVYRLCEIIALKDYQSNFSFLDFSVSFLN
jgi:hypothetical protein